MARRATTYLGAAGGIHLSQSPEEKHGIRLSFFDADGLPLSRSLERKIEQLYCREDFPRAPGDALGEPLRLPDMAEPYRGELLRNISPEKLARAGLRVVLGHPTPYLRRFLIPLLQELSCTVITVNAAAGTGNSADGSGSPGDNLPLQRYSDLAAAVRNNSATLGVVIPRGGEKALIFDERGRAVRGDLYTALLSLLVFRPGGAEPWLCRCMFRRLSKGWPSAIRGGSGERRRRVTS